MNCTAIATSITKTGARRRCIPKWRKTLSRTIWRRKLMPWLPAKPAKRPQEGFVRNVK